MKGESCELVVVAPAAKLEARPFGLNRYVLLCIYLVYTFFTGCVYWGWDGLQDMLYKSEAYLWLCTEETFNREGTPAGGVVYPDCPARTDALNGLYTVAFACQFCLSPFFGILLDFAGAKVCALVGLGLSAIGWVLLGVSSQAVPTYIAAFVLIGMSAEPGYLPLLSIANLFPSNKSLIMSIFGSVRSLSFAVPVILSVIFASPSYDKSEFREFCFGYVGVGIGFSAIVAALLIPRWGYSVAELNIQTSPLTPSLADGEKTRGVCNNGKTEGSTELVEKGMTEKQSLSDSNVITRREAEDIVPRETPMSFKTALFMWEFLLVVPLFCFSLMRAEFFTKNNKQQLQASGGGGRWVLQVYRVLNIGSFIPGPFFGKLCDTIGILYVILILNVAGLLLYTFVIPDYVACKCISCIFYFVYASFVLSNLYCYVADIFPPEHFGRLTGVASMFAGLFCLLSLPLTTLSTTTLMHLIPYNFAPANAIMVGFGLINLGILYAMFRLKTVRRREKFSANV